MIAALLVSTAAHAQTTDSLPRVSAPGAYGDSPTTGLAAGSATSRALAPPPGTSDFAIGGFDLRLSFGASWHSNPERINETNSESDAALVFSPSIGYQGNIGRHDFEVGVSAGSESYGTFDTEDSDYIRYGGALKLDLSAILIGDLYAGRTEGEEQRGSSSSRLLLPNQDEDEYIEDVLGGRLTLGRRSNLLQVYAGLEKRSLEYTNNNQDFRDRDDTEINAGLFFNIGPRTSLFVHARETDIDYLVSDPSEDNTETALTVGVAWEISEAFSASVEAGNLEKKYDDPRIEGYDSDTYLGKLVWRPTDRNSASIYLSKTTEESPADFSAFYVSELWGIDFTQEVGERGSATIYYVESTDDFDSGRVDDVTDYGISFGYTVFSWLDLGVSYNVIERRSNIAVESYEDEIFSIFATITPNFGSDN